MLISASEYNYRWTLSSNFYLNLCSSHVLVFEVFPCFKMSFFKNYVTALDDTHSLWTKKALLTLWGELAQALVAVQVIICAQRFYIVFLWLVAVSVMWLYPQSNTQVFHFENKLVCVENTFVMLAANWAGLDSDVTESR